MQLAVSGGRKLQILFAVAATAGTAIAVTTDDRAPETLVNEAREQPVEIALPHRPLVLPTGAPACGNVMTKFAQPL